MTLRFNHREMGQLRALIDVVNGYVTRVGAAPRDAGPVELVEQSLPPEAERDEQED